MCSHAPVAPAVLEGAPAVVGHDLGAGPVGLPQEGVAVVPELHALLVGELVHGGDVPPERLLHEPLELGGVLGHHLLALLVRDLHGEVAAHEGVVEGRLIGAQVHDALRVLSEGLPEGHDVAVEADGDGLPVLLGELRARDALLRVRDDLVHPALVVPLLERGVVNLGDDADAASDLGGLGLRARHAAQAGGHVNDALDVALVEVLARGVEHRDGRPVHDALGADVPASEAKRARG